MTEPLEQTIDDAVETMLAAATKADNLKDRTAAVLAAVKWWEVKRDANPNAGMGRELGRESPSE